MNDDSTRSGAALRRRQRTLGVWLLGTALTLASCAARSHPVFHGHWRVILFQTPGVSALGPTAAAGWIGTVASYDTHQAMFGRETCAAPTYATRTMTPDEFMQDYRVSAAALGLQGETVTVISVTCASAWTNRGSVLIVKSHDTLLTTWDGVFFELERRIP